MEVLPLLVSLVFDGLIATETADLPYTDTQGSREERTPRARLFSLNVRLYPYALTHSEALIYHQQRRTILFYLCVDRIYSQL